MATLPRDRGWRAGPARPPRLVLWDFSACFRYWNFGHFLAWEVQFPGQKGLSKVTYPVAEDRAGVLSGFRTRHEPRVLVEVMKEIGQPYL